jgi:phage pi2 protein 07
MHREIQLDKDYTFEFRFYTNGIQLVPSAATVAIFNNSGGTVVAATAGSIDAEGTISYTFLAAANDEDDVNFKVEVKYTVSGVDHYYWELFDVAYTPLNNNVRDEDLYPYVGELRDKVFGKTTRTTSAGSTTTLVSERLKSDRRDWTGGFCEVFITNTTVHEALITGYAKATGTVTFSPAYSTSIGTNLEVRLRSSYQTYIDEAFEEYVMQDVRGKVGMAAKYIDVNVVRKMTIFKALGIISGGKVEKEGDKWDLREKKYAKRYKTQYSKLSNEPADTDADGDISDTENAERPSYSNRNIVR